ncbi:hypothetical protein PQX77_021715 [Marasmius sp. AFHP31]|nr:hypothetical protein PQX77_021715 [Marasmius sp. AFHP31]
MRVLVPVLTRHHADLLSPGRKRKIKCNRAYPCAPCLLRGEGDACHEVEKSNIAKSSLQSDTVDDVLNRVVALERSVSKLSRLVASGSVDGYPDYHDSNAHPGPSRGPTPNQNGTERAPSTQPGLLSSDEEAALMLEDIAMGNRMNRRRAASQLEPNSNLANAQSFSMKTVLTPFTSSDRNRGLSSPSSRHLPPSGLPQEHPLALLVQPSTSVVLQILSHLPNETRSRILVRFYFDRIEWYTRVLHSPTFMSEMDSLLDQVSAHFSPPASLSPYLSAEPPSLSLPFLSTYFMVLCLAYHLIEPEICQSMNITFQDAAELSKKMYNAAQLCLWIDNYLENHSLESVQTLILMGTYQQNMGDSDSHWALLGSAIKIAQNLGLDRLGSESDKKAYAGPWKSLVRREVGRRVWWNLIYNDWSNAAAHNGVYAIFPLQTNTALPANVNDNDLKDNEPLKSASHSRYTAMTYSLTRFRFVELYRQIVDSVDHNTSNTTGPTPNFTAETDGRLLAMLKDLPTSFQAPISASTEPGKVIEYTVALIMGEALRMRLHRPFLFRGYKDDRYASSKQQCIGSAKAVIKYLKYDPSLTGMLLRRWTVMFYGFSAAVVLLIDFCHQRGLNSIEESKKELQGALNVFRTAQVVSTISQNAIVILEAMIANAEQSLAYHDKRADISERWNQVAKQTIAEANSSSKFGDQRLALTPLLPSLFVPSLPSVSSPHSPARYRKDSQPAHALAHRELY